MKETCSILGAILAIYDSFYDISMPSASKNIIDEFLPAFIQNPMDQLSKIAVRLAPHIAKVKRQKLGLAITLEKELHELFNSLELVDTNSLTEVEKSWIVISFNKRKAKRFEKAA